MYLLYANRFKSEHICYFLPHASCTWFTSLAPSTIKYSKKNRKAVNRLHFVFSNLSVAAFIQNARMRTCLYGPLDESNFNRREFAKSNITSKSRAESQKHINLDERAFLLHLAKNCTAQQSKCVSMTFQAANSAKFGPAYY